MSKSELDATFNLVKAYMDQSTSLTPMIETKGRVLRNGLIIQGAIVVLMPELSLIVSRAVVA